MKIVTFLRKNGGLPKRVVDFPLERDTSRNKIMEIVEDFNEKSYNNNGKPWKSSRILRLNPFVFIFFPFSSFFPFFRFFHFFIFFTFFLFFFFFSFFSFFSFFHFFHFFISVHFFTFSFCSFSSFFFMFLLLFFFFLHFLSFFFFFLNCFKISCNISFQKIFF